jgi:hypothetical protein
VSLIASSEFNHASVSVNVVFGEFNQFGEFNHVSGEFNQVTLSLITCVVSVIRCFRSLITCW